METVPRFAQERPLSQAEAVSIALKAEDPPAPVAKAVQDAAQAQAKRDRPVARPRLNAIASGTAQGPRVAFPRPDYTQATILPEGAGRLDLVIEQTLYRAGIGAARQRYEAEAALAARSVAGRWRNRRAARKAYVDVFRAESGVRTAQDEWSRPRSISNWYRADTTRAWRNRLTW